MLRAKAIGSLSSCARSVILGGSRCNALDGSDSSTLKKHDPKIQKPVPKKPSTASAITRRSPHRENENLCGAPGILSGRGCIKNADLVSNDRPVTRGSIIDPPVTHGPIIDSPVAHGSEPPLNTRKAAGERRKSSDQVLGVLHRTRWWGPEAEAALDELKCPSIDAYSANRVLKSVGDHSVALGFFRWLTRQPGFRHDGYTYTTMAGILGRAGRFADMESLLNEMARDGCRPSVVTYNRLIHGYGRANRLREAASVVDRMRADGCDPDRVTYCTLIDVHAKAGYLDAAMCLYRRMQEDGLAPDAFTCGVIINSLGKAGRLAESERVFRAMPGHGCTPGIVTYNIMIALQAKARDHAAALAYYRRMRASGFAPDRVTCNIIMEVLGRCGRLDEAEAVFREMRRNGRWAPDEPVYGLLVDLWGKAGNVSRARHWYDEMLRAGLRPNVPTVNSLLGALLRARHLDEALSLLITMSGLGLVPSLQTYTLLLSWHTEAPTDSSRGLISAARHPVHELLLAMPVFGSDGTGVRDHVDVLFDSVHGEERESRRGLADALIDFLHKSGLKEEAGSVWDVVARRNLYPDLVTRRRSCYCLVNLHVMSDGTAVTALSRTLAWFRREMLASRVAPRRIDIVTGWGRRSRIRGSSLVRRAVEDLLTLFGFPFFIDNANSGCFVGCGDRLEMWLSQSFVDRMHLL